MRMQGPCALFGGRPEQSQAGRDAPDRERLVYSVSNVTYTNWYRRASVKSNLGKLCIARSARCANCICAQTSKLIFDWNMEYTYVNSPASELEAVRAGSVVPNSMSKFKDPESEDSTLPVVLCASCEMCMCVPRS